VISHTRRLQLTDHPDVRLSLLALALALALAAALADCTRGTSSTPSSKQSPPGTIKAPVQPHPSFVIVLTDDQVVGTLTGMPNVAGLAAEGARFTNAMVSNSLCCPSRTAILTGLYSHDSGVYTNQGPDGGYLGFIRNGDNRLTFVRHLRRAGYRTALFGKYLNHYDGTEQPGWDTIHAFVGGDGAYYDYDWGIDGRRPIHHGTDPVDYSTDVIGSEAVDWLRSFGSNSPFLLFVAPYAPHSATIPSPADIGKTTSSSFRTAAYNEADVRDKPAYIRALSLQPEAMTTTLEAMWDREYATLLDVDRWVGRIRSTVTRLGRADDTYFIFLSDNGFTWGDHRWMFKEVPYDRSVRVPLLVTGPDVVAGRVDSVVGNVDIAATVLDLANLSPMHTDGVSLVPLLTRTGGIHRDGILLEHQDFSTSYPVPTYCGIRNEDWMFMRYATGEEELYDLRRDPDELRNIVEYRPKRATQLRDETYEAGCDPAFVPPPD
jgi:N-acetylglucosamine-6-sulfatase